MPMTQQQLFKALSGAFGGNQGAPDSQSPAPATPPASPSPMAGGPLYNAMINPVNLEAAKKMKQAMDQNFGGPVATPQPGAR